MRGRERDLLALLAARPGVVVSRADCETALLGYTAAPGSRSLDITASRLRKRGVPVQAVYGRGYVLTGPLPADLQALLGSHQDAPGSLPERQGGIGLPPMKRGTKVRSRAARTHEFRCRGCGAITRLWRLVLATWEYQPHVSCACGAVMVYVGERYARKGKDGRWRYGDKLHAKVDLRKYATVILQDADVEDWIQSESSLQSETGLVTVDSILWALQMNDAFRALHNRAHPQTLSILDLGPCPRCRGRKNAACPGCLGDGRLFDYLHKETRDDCPRCRAIAENLPMIRALMPPQYIVCDILGR